MTQKSSFIGICGAPNAGKSSLVNYLVGSKVSIVSPRPQTTRVNIRGIVVIGETQLVFVDTPGIMNPHDERQKKMVDYAWDGVSDVEQLVFLVDGKRGLTELSHKIIEGIRGKVSKAERAMNPPPNLLPQGGGVQKSPFPEGEGGVRVGLKAVAVINKIDIADQEMKLRLAQELYDTGVFVEVFMASVTNGRGLTELTDYLVKNAGNEPWAYPEDQLTDSNERFTAEEVTREKIFYLLREELPYAIDVETVSFKDEGAKGITIHQNILTNREAHKKIIIGDNASMIKRIGQASRMELTKMLGNKVHLFLHVKVTKEDIKKL